MNYISNAFSLQMLEGDAAIKVLNVNQWQASCLVKGGEWKSCVGHADTAFVFSEQLGVDIPMNRINLKMKSGDRLLVGQLIGGRLSEGTTNLPDDFSIKWMFVSIE